MRDPLDRFFLPVKVWFEQTFNEPTLPQAKGWPPIQRGENTLILAPTGSGKTLAAFLWGISRLCEELHADKGSKGIRLLYVSPLKALNNDIERNLRVPLEGSERVARSLGLEIPQIRVAVRTGDTPSKMRLAMAKHPPHILITTPESLYLLLTSPKAHDMFQNVGTVIVDEIHTVCGNKRGVHLSLSLERLEHLTRRPVQRIGLSATQKPLEEVSRFLGGQRWVESTEGPQLVPRNVTIVDASYPRPVDLKVVTVIPDFQMLPHLSIWPLVIREVAELIRGHRTTLIFCNNRRLAERTAERLNAQLSAGESSEASPENYDALVDDGIPVGLGIFGLGGEGGPIRAHHGSMSKEARQQMEQDLKEGRLPALVGTSSLELGIDIGSIDLVVQLQSPKGVSQGLQRIGRSGHLVGQTSKGRIFPTHREDVMEAAAVARGMLKGDVEETRTPQNCLDVLAQQVVAAVSADPWSAHELYHLARQSYAYRDLTRIAFDSVLGMLSGKFHTTVRARITWDRTHDVLRALPGSRLMALANVGTIPDRGAFGAYLADGKTKIGELDEEFVFETRVGDVFVLGSQTWRVAEITHDRVVVVGAPGAIPRMPFWHGDFPWRSYELGLAVGRFRREVASRLTDPGIREWLKDECALDDNSAQSIVAHVENQLETLGGISSDRAIIVEAFHDAVGEPRLVVHSPFGGRVNGPWGIALASALKERIGIQVEVLSGDDGIILRFPETKGEPPLDIVEKMGPQEARERLLANLLDSPLFGAQFRMNAARSLLLLKGKPGKRTPFWLQRLKAKDLLARVRSAFGGQDFPILAETYRDCLEDVMDVKHLEEVLTGIQEGRIRVVSVESVVPSAVATGLLNQFAGVYLYEWDTPKAERQLAALAVSREFLQNILQDVSLPDLLRSEAFVELEGWLQHTAPGSKARTEEELVLLFQELGDLSLADVVARCDGEGGVWLESLVETGRVSPTTIPTSWGAETRCVLTEDLPTYAAAFGETVAVTPGQDALSSDEVRLGILQRMLRNRGPLTQEEIRRRYDFPVEWLTFALNDLVRSRKIMSGRFSRTPEGEVVPEQWVEVSNLERLHRRSLTLLRAEVRPVSIESYVDFLHGWHHLFPEERMLRGEIRRVIAKMRGVGLPGFIWEQDILPSRISGFVPSDLEALFLSGEVAWRSLQGRVSFFFRGEGSVFLESDSPAEIVNGLSEPGRQVCQYLRDEGASYFQDLGRLLNIPQSVLESSLGELVQAGLVTNDTLQGMRKGLKAGQRARGRGQRPGPLEEELERRLKGNGATRPIPDGEVARIRRAISLRVRDARRWIGRWSLLHSPAIMGPTLSPEEKALHQARVLLLRYGVVLYELVESEEWTMGWPALRRALQILELRGEIRRGYFVEGLSGMQYALPEALEALRQRASGEQGAAPIALNACDPAAIVLHGKSPGDAAITPARLSSNYLVFWRGRVVLSAERNGENLRVASGLDPETLGRALKALVDFAYRSRRVSKKVTQWNGEPVAGSTGEPLLRSLGFHRIPRGMTWGE